MAPQITDERNEWTQRLPARAAFYARAMSVQYSPQRKSRATNPAFVIWAMRSILYLFPSTDPSKPMPSADRMHDAALKMSGIDHCRLYDLRHTFATRAVEAVVDPAPPAALLGHSRIQVIATHIA